MTIVKNTFYNPKHLSILYSIGVFIFSLDLKSFYYNHVLILIFLLVFLV